MLTNFPNGITSFGVPLLGNAPGVPIGSGQVAFVGTAAQMVPFAGSQYSTIQGAIDASAEGSVIYVAPGSYDENLTVDEDYITLIQLTGAGYGRPDVVPTTGVALVVNGQGFTSIGMRYVSADSDSVQQHGNGFYYADNVFDGTAGMAATEGCMRLVGLAADDSFSASEGQVVNNLFRGATSGAGLIIQHAAVPSGVGCTDNRIVGNRFYDNGVDILSAVNVSGGGAGIYLNTAFKDNQFMTSGAAYVYINMAAGVAADLAANSGIISGNYFADDALVAAQVNVAGQPKVYVSGNYDAAGVVNGSTFNN